MPVEVGVFQSDSAALEGIKRVLSTGVARDKVTILTPKSTSRELASVPLSDSEQPGMGAAVGTIVGGALGAAGGLGAGAAIASFLLPGAGAILGAGLLGAGLLGLGGAAGGAAAGDLLERWIAAGLPHDELFVYEDALRKGRSVVFVEVDDDLSQKAVRRALSEAGAESIDAAREKWWIGLRSAEEESYDGDFKRDEATYRKGFEAAQLPALRGKSYEEARDYLAREFHISDGSPAFRRGFERGQEYRRSCQ